MGALRLTESFVRNASSEVLGDDARQVGDEEQYQLEEDPDACNPCDAVAEVAEAVPDLRPHVVLVEVAAEEVQRVDANDTAYDGDVDNLP